MVAAVTEPLKPSWVSRKIVELVVDAKTRWHACPKCHVVMGCGQTPKELASNKVSHLCDKRRGGCDERFAHAPRGQWAVGQVGQGVRIVRPVLELQGSTKS